MFSNSTSFATAFPWRSMGRLMAIVGVLMLLILIPFGLWGDGLEKSVPQWLNAQQHHRLLFAVLGVVVLILDVLLPIPSSLVGMALCWVLGPWLGGVSMAIGLSLSFAVGYGLGRWIPEEKLRQWVGADVWDVLRNHASTNVWWWMVATRPLPVLAEMGALLAGIWHLPFTKSFMIASVTSAVVAALYAWSAFLGMQAPDSAVTVLVMLVLPTLTWFFHRWWMRRLSASRH